MVREYVSRDSDFFFNYKIYFRKYPTLILKAKITSENSFFNTTIEIPNFDKTIIRTSHKFIVGWTEAV